MTSLSTSLGDMGKVVETDERKNEMRKRDVFIYLINLVSLL